MKKWKCFILAALIFLHAAPAFAAFDVINATLTGQLENGVNTGHIDMASTAFSLGGAGIIYLEFDEPVKFSGRVGIEISIPVIGGADAESTGAEIYSLYVNGNDMGARGLSFGRNEAGNMVMYLDAYELTGIEISSIEVEFTVRNAPRGVEDEPTETAATPPDEPADETESTPAENTAESPAAENTDNESKVSDLAFWLFVCIAIIAVAIIFLLIKRKNKN